MTWEGFRARAEALLWGTTSKLRWRRRHHGGVVERPCGIVHVTEIIMPRSYPRSVVDPEPTGSAETSRAMTGSRSLTAITPGHGEYHFQRLTTDVAEHSVKCKLRPSTTSQANQEKIQSCQLNQSQHQLHHACHTCKSACPQRM